jgi:LysM repeat protein
MTPLRRLRILAALGLAGLSLTAYPVQRAAADDGTYVVQPNDTLSGIALSFGTTVSALMAANNLQSPDRITAGEVLVISGAGTAPAGAASTAAPTIYVVQWGDTLSALAVRFGVSLASLAQANNLPDWCTIQAGQHLIIPSVDGADSSALVSQVATAPAASQTPVASQAPVANQAPIVSSSADIPSILTAEAQAAGVDPSLVKALAWQESGWQMITAFDGGMGVMQLMPDTVDWVSSYLLGYRINPYNPVDNIHAGVAMLSYYLRLFGGDVTMALGAYHQGLTSVRTQGISAETAHYIANILALQARF